MFKRISTAETAIRATGAYIEWGGDRAFHHRAEDRIQLPAPEYFTGTPTSTAQESRYAVALHELSHWTGAPHRLNREKGERFADKAYCFEELVAELSSAFLCAHLGVAHSPRPDHAQYIDQYLTLMRADKRAIFAAATAAGAATQYILAFGDAAPSGG